METKRSHVIVGVVTLILLLMLVGFILWLARFSRGGKSDYDIFFQQSVAGLTVGSAVSFSGVPVGQVKEIALMPKTPQFIRVRVELQSDTPVLEGTIASLSAVGFTGVTAVQLSGSMSGQKPLTTHGPFGVPVIPSRPSGIGQLLETAPEVLERAATLLARLNDLFDDDNRARFGTLVDNLEKISGELAAEGPSLRASAQELQRTLTAATAAAEGVADASNQANRMMGEDVRPMLADLAKAIATADTTLDRVNKVAAAAEPGVRNVSTVTVPELNRLILDLGDVSRRVGVLAEKLDQDPAGMLSGNKRLPDYRDGAATKGRSGQ